jgi:hypothetical protein
MKDVETLLKVWDELSIETQDVIGKSFAGRYGSDMFILLIGQMNATKCLKDNLDNFKQWEELFTTLTKTNTPDSIVTSTWDQPIMSDKNK